MTKSIRLLVTALLSVTMLVLAQCSKYDSPDIELAHTDSVLTVLETVTAEWPDGFSDTQQDSIKATAGARLDEIAEYLKFLKEEDTAMYGASLSKAREQYIRYRLALGHAEALLVAAANEAAELEKYSPEPLGILYDYYLRTNQARDLVKTSFRLLWTVKPNDTIPASLMMGHAEAMKLAGHPEWAVKTWERARDNAPEGSAERAGLDSLIRVERASCNGELLEAISLEFYWNQVLYINTELAYLLPIQRHWNVGPIIQEHSDTLKMDMVKLIMPEHVDSAGNVYRDEAFSMAMKCFSHRQALKKVDSLHAQFANEFDSTLRLSPGRIQWWAERNDLKMRGDQVWKAPHNTAHLFVHYSTEASYPTQTKEFQDWYSTLEFFE